MLSIFLFLFYFLLLLLFIFGVELLLLKIDCINLTGNICSGYLHYIGRQVAAVVIPDPQLHPSQLLVSLPGSVRGSGPEGPDPDRPLQPLPGRARFELDDPD